MLALDFMRANEPRMEHFIISVAGEGYTIAGSQLVEMVKGKRVAPCGPRRPGESTGTWSSSTKQAANGGHKAVTSRGDRRRRMAIPHAFVVRRDFNAIHPRFTHAARASSGATVAR